MTDVESQMLPALCPEPAIRADVGELTFVVGVHGG
jgi:hypothetical protein